MGGRRHPPLPGASGRPYGIGLPSRLERPSGLAYSSLARELKHHVADKTPERLVLHEHLVDLRVVF
jgi:hypothetical protein